MKKLASLGSTPEVVLQGFRCAAENALFGEVIGYALGDHLGYTWEAGLLMRRLLRGVTGEEQEGGEEA